MEGEPDILVFNGDHGDPDRFFLTAKGGKLVMAHNQLDVGSFIVENQGIRWGIDPGTDSYSLPGFFDYSFMRWQYFRNSNLGQSTLNIDGNLAYQLKEFPVENIRGLNEWE
jgi:oligo-alginate lyase